jgi:hypothetical protein
MFFVFLYRESILSDIQLYSHVYSTCKTETFPTMRFEAFTTMNMSMLCEISSSHGGEYDVQNCRPTFQRSVDNHFTRQYIPEDNSEHDVYVGRLGDNIARTCRYIPC